MAEYIKRKAAYSLAKKVCKAVDSNPRVLLPHIILDLIDDIPAADVRPVVVCAECQHNNACLTQAFVEDCGKIPLDRNTFFCADGERAGNA